MHGELEGKERGNRLLLLQFKVDKMAFLIRDVCLYLWCGSLGFVGLQQWNVENDCTLQMALMGLMKMCKMTVTYRRLCGFNKMCKTAEVSERQVKITVLAALTLHVWMGEIIAPIMVTGHWWTHPGSLSDVRMWKRLRKGRGTMWDVVRWWRWSPSPDQCQWHRWLEWLAWEPCGCWTVHGGHWPQLQQIPFKS